MLDPVSDVGTGAPALCLAHGVDDHLGGEAEQVDVGLVDADLLGDEGVALGGVVDGRDLVGEDGVDRGVGSHHGDLRRRQRERGVGVEGGAAHGVQPGAVGLAHDDAQLGHGGLGDGGDHLGPVADDALGLDGGADHEAGHVGEEHERDVEGVAQPDEPGRLVGGVDEEHAAEVRGVVGHDPDGSAVEAAEAADQLLREERLVLEERLVVDDAVDEGVHVEGDGLVDRHDVVGQVVGGRRGLVAGRLLGPARREVGEPGPGLVEGVLVVVGQCVAAAGHGGVHPGTAHLLERGVLADHLLGHAGRTQVHGGVAIHHEHHVAEAGDVGTTSGRGSEQAADLGDPAREADLGVEDATGAPSTREQLDLIGESGTGRVDQPEDGKIMSEGVLGLAQHLLDGARTPRAGLHGGIVGHHAHPATLDRARARHHAVGGQVVGRGVGQQPLLDERAGVEQQVDAVPHEQLALGLELRSQPLEVPGQRPLGRGGDAGVRVGGCRFGRLVHGHDLAPSPGHAAKGATTPAGRASARPMLTDAPIGSRYA